jgi:hypothetical protein
MEARLRNNRLMRGLVVALLLSSIALKAQEASAPAPSNLPAGYRLLGKVKPRSTKEIKSSNWILGCETLDRDMTDYDQYKEYLAPLGAKRIRLQAGWAKTEKAKGVYDWAWLDHIIDDAVSRGIEPWLETSYGNPIYPGGGGTNLSAGIPTSEEALAAWDRWVAAMAERYRGKVREWEVWNEPNFGDNTINSPEAVADLNVRTAAIIKRIQPEAKISGMSMGHIDLKWADTFFRRIHEKKAMHLFDNMAYHDYVYNPDSNYGRVLDLRRVLDKYAPQVKLRQGENGAPSMGGPGRGALGNYDWSETKQAKWITRRMLGDLGHDIESSILGIIDMNYNQDAPIKRLNVKGLIHSDSSRRAIKPKIAYYAMQHVTALFDDSLRRIREVHLTHNSNAPVASGEVKFNPGTDRGLSVYGYEKSGTGKQVFTVWMNEGLPVESNQTMDLRFTFIGANLKKPVYVDILSGAVYEIPATLIKREGSKLTIEKLPVYDAPILVADQSVVSLR